MSTATNARPLTAAQAREVITLLRQQPTTPEIEQLLNTLMIQYEPWRDVPPRVLGALPDGTPIVLDHSPETGVPCSVTSYPSGILFDIGIDEGDNRILIGDEFSIEYVSIERMRVLRDMLNVALEPMIEAHTQYMQAHPSVNPPARSVSPELIAIKAWIDQQMAA